MIEIIVFLVVFYLGYKILFFLLGFIFGSKSESKNCDQELIFTGIDVESDDDVKEANRRIKQ